LAIGRTIGKGKRGAYPHQCFIMNVLYVLMFVFVQAESGSPSILKLLNTRGQIVPKHALLNSRMSITEAGAKVGLRTKVDVHVKANIVISQGGQDALGIEREILL